MIWSLHGAFGSPGDWDALAASLHPRQLERVDLWAAEHDQSLHDWARSFNARAALDQAPVLLGYSLGARLALHALVDAGAPWAAAILVSPHPGFKDTSERTARRQSDDRWLERFDAIGWAEFWREWTAQPVLRTARERAAPRRRDAMRRGLAGWSLAEQDDLGNVLPRIDCPVLWITGERDEKFSAIGREAIAAIRDARHVVVPGSGHRVPWDSPDAFAGLVRDFLEGTPA